MGMIINPFGVAPAGAAPGDLRTVLGNSQYTSVSGTNTSLGWAVKITAPSGADSLISAVRVMIQSTGGSVDFKALLMSDNAGQPSGTILAIGTATTYSIIASQTIIELPFASAQTLTTGTSYWIGFVPSTTVSLGVVSSDLSNTAAYSVACTYASPTWNAAGDSVNSFAGIYAITQQAGAATGTHQQGNSTFFIQGTNFRLALPPYSVGDRILLNVATWFGAVTDPAGFTEISNQQINASASARHRIIMRTMDGTEDGTVLMTVANTTACVATVLRGGGALEGMAHNTGSGTTATSSAVTTSGANRRVFNALVSGDKGGGSSNADTSDTWTDIYSVGSTFSFDYTVSLSYKDVAAAGSSGTEVRTISDGHWHTSSFAIPDA